MIISNIFATETYEKYKDIIRQPVEMYLPFQVIENPKAYRYTNDKRSIIRIIDNGVGDPQYTEGKSYDTNLRVLAAHIINANEFVLTDDLNCAKSLYKTIENYYDLKKNYNLPKDCHLAAVIHACDLEDFKTQIKVLSQLNDITTFMIPKDLNECTLWNTCYDDRGRAVLAQMIRDIESNYNYINHDIHLLGSWKGVEELQTFNDQDFKNIRSLDSGLWISEKDFYANRTKEIDLYNNDIDLKTIEKIFKQQEDFYDNNFRRA